MKKMLLIVDSNFRLPLVLWLAAVLFLFSPLANAQPHLWGMTSGGGQYGAGAIFNTDGSGNNETVQYSFFQHEGAHPLFTNLVQANDGMLYGMTYKGGINDLGVLFQFNPVTSTYTHMLDFDGITNGSKPLGSLMQASDGMLYGMTYKGGAYDKGVLFQFNPATSTYLKKLDFDGTTYGCYPHGALMQASDGNLYGMTVQGGANDMGVLFQYNPAGSVCTNILNFAGSANGSYPLGTLMQASDGMLYGMTCNGGVNDMGVLFQYNPATSAYIKKLDFAGITNGNNPLGFLIEASDGNLYGMTNRGGANDMGVLFQYDPATTACTNLLDFAGAANGSYPYGSLMQASDGNIYGMTELGGGYDSGVLFQYDPVTSNYSNRVDFAGSTNGSSPYGTLIQAGDGNLYGMTNLGGVNGIGVLFQYNPISFAYEKKFDFGAVNGRTPYGSLMQAGDGNLYGMTNQGGLNDVGVLFQYNPVSASYDNILDFDEAMSGSHPEGSLLQARDGNLYGMTYGGGANGMGVLFGYNLTTNTYTNLLDFDGAINGSNPHGSLMQASDGNMYGMTYGGGANDMGVLFQYHPVDSSYTNLLDFEGPTNGSHPYGSLMQASDGNLYGMTYGGGANDMGVLFQYNPATSAYTNLLDFAGSTNGSHPHGSLIQASDGNLYGMTNAGGANDMGVLFQYNPATNTYTNLLDFAGAANGSHPYGSLMQASDGNLYGMTYRGGANDMGVLFQYNPATSAYTGKLEYHVTNGKFPYGNLIEINSSVAGIFNSSNLIPQISIYPNPNNGVFTIQSGEGDYSIVNALGQTIESFKLNAANNCTINIGNLSNGIYFIVGFNDTSITKQKVIVAK
jgi:uncharacterized repeat protein (TIGR03803 family)